MSSRVNRQSFARHRARRRRRLSALGGAVVVTLVVAAATVGVLPQVWSNAAESSSGESSLEQASLSALAEPVSDAMATQDATAKDLQLNAKKVDDVKTSESLPANSGQGRRIVFSDAAQRVWLVSRNGNVKRTYLVSGSKYDNLNPGTYRVNGKTRHATAFDYSGSMEYFVQFATGYTAPIGFHTVPVDNAGRPEQSKEQLGTPTSAGCVRQWRDDAVVLWDFAQLGTTVVVTA